MYTYVRSTFQKAFIYIYWYIVFCDDSEDTQHPACPEGKSPPGSVAAQPKAVVHGGTHSAVIQFCCLKLFISCLMHCICINLVIHITCVRESDRPDRHVNFNEAPFYVWYSKWIMYFPLFQTFWARAGKLH